MRAVGSIAILILLAALGFWVYRGSQVFRAQLREYTPTPYGATVENRALRERARTLTREVTWHLDDGTRQVAYYLPPRAGWLLIYAHGSPGQGLGLLDGEAARLAERGHGALLIDLPGYGASEGERTWGRHYVESFGRAIDFSLDQAEVDPERIAGFGYSNGGSVVARAAARDDRVRAIVLLASYTNLTDHLHAAFRRRTPAMGRFAIAAARWAGVPVEELDTLKALREMETRPVLVVSGGRDRQIPTWMGPLLQSAVPGAELKQYQEMGHLDFAQKLGAKYIDMLNDFLARAGDPHWNSPRAVEM